MAGMVDRFRAELLPNGMVRLFDNETLSASLFRRKDRGGDLPYAIECTSGPWVSAKEAWDVAYAAFTDNVPDCTAPGSIGCKIRVKHGH